MTDTATATAPATRELVLERTLDAPRAAVWRCWTEPALMERWFCPAPWKATDIAVDLRAGGRMAMTMRGPEGEAFPNEGVYLEVEPGRRLVFTDAYRPGWEPVEEPFFTGIVTLEDAPGGGTRYTARARHWTEAARQRHEEMGFHDGWGKAADQLEALARSL
jgi:uncharacterized protein YndB with AHSA1/START domain